MIGCIICGHVWDNCECPDLEAMGQNRDIFEMEIETPVKDLGSHYRNEFKGVKVDVYRVLQIFGVTDPVAQHIVKKLLRGTKKGHDEMTVWNEVFQACERKKEMIDEEK